MKGLDRLVKEKLTKLLNKKFAAAITVLLILVLLDQLSKGVVRAAVAKGSTINAFGILQIVNVSNKGTVFGLFSNVEAFFYFLIPLSAVVAAAALISYSKLTNNAQRFGVLFIASGAIGNLIDRLLFGAVTDFIKITFINGLPAFNLADAYLSVGAAAMIFGYVAEHFMRKKQ